MDRIWVLLTVVMLAVTGGCGGGDMGRVTGTVKADGEALSGALLEFYPEAGGRASTARTDENGAYELRYSRDEMGAKVGKHLVKISTAGDPGGYGSKTTPETLPAKYNVTSELVRTVEPGSNVIDFELDYVGKIIQPPGADSGRY